MHEYNIALFIIYILKVLYSLKFLSCEQIGFYWKQKYYMFLLAVKVFPPDTSLNNDGITEVATYVWVVKS